MVGVDVKFVDVKSMYYMIYTNDETALFKGQKNKRRSLPAFFFQNFVLAASNTKNSP